jgi:hypothetical protein
MTTRSVPGRGCQRGEVQTKHFTSLDDARKWVFGDALKRKAAPGPMVELKQSAALRLLPLHPPKFRKRGSFAAKCRPSGIEPPKRILRGGWRSPIFAAAAPPEGPFNPAPEPEGGNRWRDDVPEPDEGGNGKSEKLAPLQSASPSKSWQCNLMIAISRCATATCPKATPSRSAAPPACYPVDHLHHYRSRIPGVVN